MDGDELPEEEEDELMGRVCVRRGSRCGELIIFLDLCDFLMLRCLMELLRIWYTVRRVPKIHTLIVVVGGKRKEFFFCFYFFVLL